MSHRNAEKPDGNLPLFAGLIAFFILLMTVLGLSLKHKESQEAPPPTKVVLTGTRDADANLPPMLRETDTPDCGDWTAEQHMTCDDPNMPYRCCMAE